VDRFSIVNICVFIFDYGGLQYAIIVVVTFSLMFGKEAADATVETM
jgi:hypothetical protein